MANNGLKSIHIFGGEPFLRDDLQFICQELTAREISISIATNAQFLDANNLQWIKDNNVFLAITLHGPQLIHDEITSNPGSFEKAIQSIKTALELEVNFAITTCINKKNVNNYKILINYCSNIGVKDYFVLYFSPIGRGNNLIQYIMSNTEWELFINDLQKFKHSLDSNIEISYELSVFQRKNITYLNYQYICNPCSIESKELFVIDSNGDVYPCLLLLKDPRFGLGNLKQIGLNAVLDSNLNKKIQNAVEIPTDCLNCSFLNLCKGGCIAYKNSQYLDFRCSSSKDHILVCPLFSRILY